MKYIPGTVTVTAPKIQESRAYQEQTQVVWSGTLPGNDLRKVENALLLTKVVPSMKPWNHPGSVEAICGSNCFYICNFFCM